jgi:hypothetical protein
MTAGSYTVFGTDMFRFYDQVIMTKLRKTGSGFVVWLHECQRHGHELYLVCDKSI